MSGSQHLRALRVHHEASRLLECGILSKEPLWYRSVVSVPPSTSLVKVTPVRLSGDNRIKRDGKPSKRDKIRHPRYFHPETLKYPEDKIRSRFYQDHPWELARPKVVLEDSGKESLSYRWSKLKQPGRAVDGESVVQRTLWLIHNTGSSKEKAYNLARAEFYQVRLKEDIQRRIAIEEAQSVGAVFGKSYMEIGTEIEGAVLKTWEEQASKELEARKQRLSLVGGEDVGEEVESNESAAVPKTN